MIIENVIDKETHSFDGSKGYGINGYKINNISMLKKNRKDNKNNKKKVNKILCLVLATILLMTSFFVKNSLEDSNIYATTFKYANDPLVSVIDPGHGGNDPGAIKNGLVEKDLNLKVAQYLRDELLQYPYVEVYMTRETTNEKPSLYERVLMAKKLKADALISIHFNSSDYSYERGAEALIAGGQYNSERAKEGKALGDKILGHIAARGFVRETSGDARDGLFTRFCTDGTTYENGAVADYYGIVRWSMKLDVNGLIIEHAYVSNKSDAQVIKNDAALHSLAQADALGIAEYFGLTIDPDVVYAGTDYSSVFDKYYYANKYPDLKNAFGYDGQKLLQHFVTNGIREGRQASEEFNVNYYKNRYADLKRAFGSDNAGYMIHYIHNGKKEGRYGENPAYYNGVDYSDVYDIEYYYNTYSDLQMAYGKNPRKLIEHFVNCGMKEGRRGSERFNPEFYRNEYADLRNAFGDNKEIYYLHYIQNGKKEGRKAEKPGVYKNVDYSLVYDKEYYRAKYEDLQRAFGNDDYAYIKHFVESGMNEGRKANQSFDVNIYKNKYADLQNAFGDNNKLYYLHYMNYGYGEGRNCDK